MSNKRSTRCTFLAFVAASAATLTMVSAQTWVPQKKTGSFDFVYARGTSNRHLFSESVSIPPTGDSGRAVDLGQEFVNTAFLRVDYGLTDRLALSGDVAYVSARYDAGQYQAIFGESALDDGVYHGTSQDARAELRYAALQTKSLTVTPFAGAVVPTHPYESEGHAAPGRGIYQLPVGCNVGYIWSRKAHTTYLEGRYAYSFLRHKDYNFARSNAYVDVGTYLTSSLSIRGVAGWERTHGGIDWATGINTAQDFEVHDARTSSRYVSAGLGVSYDLGRTTTISVAYSQILTGANVVDTHSFSVTSSWYFGGAPSVKTGWARKEPLKVASFGEASLFQ